MTIVKRKSDRTRESILAAAARQFSQHGYERTTVREIAAEAGIDAAMVIRYFGSKDALFARVAAIELRLPDLSATPVSEYGVTLVRHFLDIWEGGASDGGLAVLLRSAASNDYAADKLRETYLGQVLPAIARTGESATAPARAGLVASQLLGLALTRYVLKLPPVVALPREKIVREVGATIQRYLTGG